MAGYLHEVPVLSVLPFIAWSEQLPYKHSIIKSCHICTVIFILYVFQFHPQKVHKRGNSSRCGKKPPVIVWLITYPAGACSQRMCILKTKVPYLICWYSFTNSIKIPRWAITLVSWHGVMHGQSSFYFWRTLLVLWQSTGEMISTTEIS